MLPKVLNLSHLESILHITHTHAHKSHTYMAVLQLKYLFLSAAWQGIIFTNLLSLDSAIYEP